MQKKVAILLGLIAFLYLIYFVFLRPEQAMNLEEEKITNKSFIDSKPDETPTQETFVSKMKDSEEAETKRPPKKKPSKEEASKSEESNSNAFRRFQEQSREMALFKLIGDHAVFGGDQLLGKAETNDQDRSSEYYKAAVSETKIWPDSVVPYVISAKLPKNIQENVKAAIDYMNYETPVEFRPLDSNYDRDGVIFEWNSELPCSSYVGSIGGVQPIYLNETCSTQSVLHEMMHALGFVHEQQLGVRSDYVEIMWNQIEDKYLFNFALAPEVMTDLYEGMDNSFTYESIMIYEKTAFAKPGQQSMKSLTEEDIEPVSKGLSEIDKRRLDYIY